MSHRNIRVVSKNICNSLIFLATTRHAGGAASSSVAMSGEGSGAVLDLVPDPELFIHYTRSTDEPFITADYGGGYHVACTLYNIGNRHAGMQAYF